MSTRRENVPGRTDGDYKPWLSNADASARAKAITSKGCHCCGTVEPPPLPDDFVDMITTPGAERPTSWWDYMTDTVTGEEHALCWVCVMELVAQGVLSLKIVAPE